MVSHTCYTGTEFIKWADKADLMEPNVGAGINYKTFGIFTFKISFLPEPQDI